MNAPERARLFLAHPTGACVATASSRSLRCLVLITLRRPPYGDGLFYIRLVRSCRTRRVARAPLDALAVANCPQFYYLLCRKCSCSLFLVYIRNIHIQRQTYNVSTVIVPM